MRTYRNNRDYRDKSQALRRKAMKTGMPCHICLEPISFDADWKHPLSFTADHLMPIATGGTMRGEIAPAHRSCNSRRGAGAVPMRAKKPEPATDWY